MSSSSTRTGLRVVLALLALVLGIAVQSIWASDVITGTLSKVDTGAKTIAVKTADGTVHTVKFTEKTTVEGLKGVTKGAGLAGKEGGHVIVRTVGEGSKETAHSVVWAGDKTVKSTDVVVDDAAKGSKTVAVKTADGTKDTFTVAGDATVDAGKDVGRYSETGVKKGEHVTVYYTEEAGKKIAHVFKHL